MAKKVRTVLTQLTTAELKRLLVARERIDVLDKEKAKLLKELAVVERELRKLMGGKAPTRRKVTKRKVTKRKATKKKAAKKKVTKRKATRKKATRKKTAKKVVRKKATRGKAGGSRIPLEDVIVSVLKKAGGKMSFQDLLATIVKGKLYKSKAASFDNVLRRTLSTSGKVKRVGRGIYAVA